MSDVLVKVHNYHAVCFHSSFYAFQFIAACEAYQDLLLTSIIPKTEVFQGVAAESAAKSVFPGPAIGIFSPKILALFVILCRDFEQMNCLRSQCCKHFSANNLGAVHRLSLKACT